MLGANPLLFFGLFFAVIVDGYTAINYPNQRYVLQKKFPDGTIRKVKTYDQPATREQVEREYGPGRYALKAMKPRITVIWKDGPKPSEDTDETVESPLLRLVPLERKTKYLTAGLVGLGIGSVVGFGATAVGLLNQNLRLNRTDAIMEAMQAKNLIPPFYCGYCYQQLLSPIDKFCSQCGKKNSWPEGQLTGEISDKDCAHCQFPVRLGQLFCRECGGPIQTEASPTRWRLP